MTSDLISDSPFDYQVSTKQIKGETVVLSESLGALLQALDKHFSLDNTQLHFDTV